MCGVANSLLWERGSELFARHPWPLFYCSIVLPIIGGFLTSEKPLFTIFVFAFSGGLPWNDMPPMSIGLWPFYWMCAEFYKAPLFELVAQFAVTLMLAVVALGFMSVPYAALVLAGRSARIKLASRRRKASSVCCLRVTASHPSAGLTAL
jgi:hypothetical protein